MNVIDDPYIPGYDKGAMLREGLRMLDPASRKLAASAFWLIHWNTPEISRPLMDEWLGLPDSEGYVVERAVIPKQASCLDGTFGAYHYPMTVAVLGKCDVYKITRR